MSGIGGHVNRGDRARARATRRRVDWFRGEPARITPASVNASGQVTDAAGMPSRGLSPVVRFTGAALVGDGSWSYGFAEGTVRAPDAVVHAHRDVPLTAPDGTVIGTADLRPDGTVTGAILTSPADGGGSGRYTDGLIGDGTGVPVGFRGRL